MAKTLRVKKTALDADEVAREKLKVQGREEDLLKVKEKQIAKYKGGVENYLANIRSARVGAAGVYGAAAAAAGLLGVAGAQDGGYD
eukprot:SAG22_NODE_2082_length_3036_cov_40.046646_6_plen_86_part_00